MSNSHYNIRWKQAINELMVNIRQENSPLYEFSESVQQNPKSRINKQPQEWFLHYAVLYIRYIQIYRQLEEAYDQLTHPQKRVLLKEFLQNTMLRMVQLKRTLIFYNTETYAIRSEYINFDKILDYLKITHREMNIPVPRFFKEQDWKERDKRNQMIDKLLLQIRDTNQPEEEIIDERFALEANIETAVRIIQKNERGRQGIERALLAISLRKMDKKSQERKARMAEGMEIQEESEREDAILVIQKYFRGYKCREQVWFMRQAELEFLGMVKKDQDPNDKNSDLYKYNSRQLGLKNLQKEQDKNYQKAVDELKQEYADLWSDDIKDKMLDERRAWIRDFMEQHEFKGLPRSAKDFYEKDKVKPPLTPEEEEAIRIAMEQKAKDKKKKKDQKKAGKKGKKGKESEKDIFLAARTAQGPSEAIQKLQENVDQYNKEWLGKNEHENFEQGHDPQIVKNVVMPEIEQNVKNLVDEMIDIELGNLRMKYKLKKPKKAKKKKKKKAKKAKKVPGARLCKNRDPRDMLAELIEAGIVKKLMPATFDDLIGEPNLLRAKQEQLMMRTPDQPSQPDPSYWDLRNYLTENIAIPLGSEYVRNSIERCTFINFFGPHGSGKTLAVRALATQTDAMVVDLSPSTIENQYPDKNSTAKMLYMAFTVAKQYQPAIIYIDEVEEIFKVKKKKKKKVGDVAGGPNFARLKKPLEAFKKAKYIKKEDRVAVITCTSKPWNVNKKVLKKFSEKKVYFPFPNYGTRKQLLQYYLESKGFQIPTNFPLSTLAHVTEGFTGGNFREAINKVITERRLLQLVERPLTVSEFIGPLSNQPITYQQEYAKFREFFDDLSGVKKRRTDFLAPPESEEDKKKGKKKK